MFMVTKLAKMHGMYSIGALYTAWTDHMYRAWLHGTQLLTAPVHLQLPAY